MGSQWSIMMRAISLCITKMRRLRRKFSAGPILKSGKYYKWECSRESRIKMYKSHPWLKALEVLSMLSLTID